MNTATSYDYDENIFSDLHKDAYGYRPGGHEFYTASPARKQEIWDIVCDDLDREIDRERAEQKAAAVAFNETIANIQELCNCDRKDAIRHYINSLDLSQGDIEFYGSDYIAWEAGLSYHDEIVQEIKEVLNEAFKKE